MPRSPAAADASTAPGARRWTPGAALARAREVTRHEGARSLAFRVLGEMVYRRLVLVERDLSAATAPAETPPRLRFEFLDERALDAYEALRPGRAAQAEERLAAGDRCFATWRDERLAAVRWLATGAPHVEYLGLRLPLAADEIYHYDTFTDPAMRRLGLSLASQLALYPRLREEGRRWAIRAILPENRAAVADAARAGYVARGRIGYVGVGSLRRDFVRWDRGRRG